MLRTSPLAFVSTYITTKFEYRLITHPLQSYQIICRWRVESLVSDRIVGPSQFTLKKLTIWGSSWISLVGIKHRNVLNPVGEEGASCPSTTPLSNDFTPSAATIKSAFFTLPSASVTEPSSALAPTTQEFSSSLTSGHSSHSLLVVRRSSSLCKSTLWTVISGAPYCFSAPSRSIRFIFSKVVASKVSQAVTWQPRALSKEKPSLESTRVPFGESTSAAPTSAANLDFSRTVIEWPAWRRATAAQRPAMPAPTTMMFSDMPLFQTEQVLNEAGLANKLIMKLKWI